MAQGEARRLASVVFADHKAHQWAAKEESGFWVAVEKGQEGGPESKEVPMPFEMPPAGTFSRL